MIVLDTSMYLGKGLHKAAYVYPKDDGKVIKIPFNPKDDELRHELAYRKARQIRHLQSKLLTKYYGTVETDKGVGYVFERVLNADGTSCETLEEYLDKQQEAGWPNVNSSRKIVEDFMQQLVTDRILTNDTCMENVLLQRDAEGEIHLRIIDNIGSPVKIPLVYYWDIMTLSHIHRHLRRLRKSFKVSEKT